MRARGFKGPWASPTPGHDSTSWCWWGPRKGSFKRDFSRIGSVGAQGDKQWAWGLGWEGSGDSPACVTWAPPSSQFLSVPLRHRDAHLPFWRAWAVPAAPLSWVQMAIPSASPPTPPTGLTPWPTQIKGLGKSQQCLPAPSPSREEGPWLSWRPELPIIPQPSCREGGK